MAMQTHLEPPYLIVKPGVSEDEFYRLADEDSDWEYLDGRIVMHSPASERHEDLFAFLITLLRGFLGERGGAVVRGSRYRRSGIEEIWIVNPFRNEVQVGTRSTAGYTTKTLTAGRLEAVVVPGFWIEVSWLWQGDLPPALQCLLQLLG